MYLQVLCNSAGEVLKCHIYNQAIPDPHMLHSAFRDFYKEAGDHFRVVSLHDVADPGYLPNMLALLQLATRTESDIGQIIDRLFCDLLNAGMKLKDAEPITRS